MRRTVILAALLVGTLGWPPPADAAKPESPRARHIREHYTKHELRIPMRDGARLFTAVYVPNDRAKRYPLLLHRTPYRAAPYGVDRYRASIGPSAALEQAGYIFVIQDVRGRFMSEGTFQNLTPHLVRKRGRRAVDESSDTYDTVAFVLQRLKGLHNGRVGLWGISYPGFYAAAGAIEGHPAIKAISPQAPIADWFWDDVHRHGAFVLPLTFNFLASFGVKRPGLHADWPERFNFGTPDGYQFFLDLGPLSNVERRHFKGRIPFWNKVTAHPNYDAFWQRRNLLPRLKRIWAAVLVVGGWYDTEDLYGALKTYAHIERQCPRADNRLVMGPWAHGGWARSRGDKLGDSRFGFATSEHYQRKVELPFFEHHLKRGKPSPRLPEALVFETGANRWRRLKHWPPRRHAKARKLYLRRDGALGWSAPREGGGTHDTFVSDPRKPVPYTMKITTRWSKQWMAEDQRFAAWRPDVLVYATLPLKEDLTLAGPLRATLHVSTSQSAADWVVKLIDVLPGKLAGEGKKHVYHRGGQQLLVRGDVIRGRFRNSYSRPEPFAPNKVTKVAFTMPDVLHTFKRGHRILVHVQSSWFPFIDRNPQRYVPNIFAAKPSDFVAATHRVFRSPQRASHLTVTVLER